jgi:DNA polymerase I-like protein with 3'-5' exonuclease and polymerase domains
MKWAMLKIDQDSELGGDCLEGGSTGAQLLLQVHDEIIMSLPDNVEAEWILKKVTHIMDNAATLLVPLKTSGGIALNWAEAK